MLFSLGHSSFSCSQKAVQRNRGAREAGLITLWATPAALLGSGVVRLESWQFSMLFTGNAETDQREWLMEHHPIQLAVNVLKASHHGSRNGADGTFSGQSWMEVVDPHDVAISVHPESQFDHPHPEAMTIYENAVGADDLHCTSRHGTVRVYGYADGRPHRIFQQFPSDDSCRFSE